MTFIGMIDYPHELTPTGIKHMSCAE